MNRVFFRKFVACFLLVILMFTLFSIDHAGAMTLREMGTAIANLPSTIGGAIVSAVLPIILKANQIFIEFILIPIANYITALSGKLLNYSIDFTIFKGLGSDEVVLNPLESFDSSIREVWIMVRDLFNLTFIFILLYVAIKKIMGDFKKELVFSIILSAIFINFSFFVTRSIIDMGNVFATSIYNQMEKKIENVVIENADNIKTDFVLRNMLGNDSQIQLSEILRTATGFDNINKSAVVLKDLTVKNTGDALGGAILRLLTLIIMGFVFLAMAFLMIGRFVILIMLIASSPVGFLFGSVPKIKSISSKWWDTLINQVALAPVFMFFMYMIVNISQSDALQKARTGDSENGGIGIGIYFNYILIIALLIGALKVSKKMSGAVSGIASKATSFVAGAALAAATGGAALAGRQLLGRGAAALASSNVGKSLQERGAKGGLVGGLSNMTLKGIKGTSNASFDLRNSRIAQGTMGQIKNLSGGAVDIQGALGSLGNTGKAGGDYGKDKKGFSGWKAKQEETVIKKAQEYDKVAKDREAKADRIAQEKNQVKQKKDEEEKAKKKLEEAENELATSSVADRATKQAKRDAAKVDYMAKKASRVAAQKDTVAGIENRAEARFEDDSYVPTTDPRKVAYNEAKKKIKIIQNSQKLNKTKLDSGGQTKDEYNQEEIRLQKELKQAVEGMEEAKAEGIKSQVEEVEKEILDVNNPNKDQDRILIGILKARQMRKDYAKQLRTQLVTFSQISRIPGLGGDEREGFAKLVESAKGDSKEKSEEEKTLAALLKQIEELNKKK